jgi:hypothetical protein
VKRLLLNCDQVFDVLTRGPFPAGQPEDEAVEHHLRACHDCRRLAEALRPAVALMHEAIASDQPRDLPEYQGSLEEPRRLEVVKLAVANKDRGLATRARRRVLTAENPRHTRRAVGGARFVAASLLLVISGALLYAIGASQDSRGLLTAVLGRRDIPPMQVADGLASEQGLMTLASLKLPLACMPLSHRPLSAEHATEIAAAIASGTLDGLRCCTECHHAAGSETRASYLAAATQQHCQLCHRG